VAWGQRGCRLGPRAAHAELEERLGADMSEVVRQLFQDHWDLRDTHAPLAGGATMYENRAGPG
jgi:hypothetical protein